MLRRGLAVDSVIMYGAMKAIFQRERPFSGGAEGKFFSGNWSSGSFPSGHAMFDWTIASVIAHEYPKWPVAVAMYGLATVRHGSRVTAGVHFPSDVVAGGVMGYLIGRYVAKQDNHLPGDAPAHSRSKILRVEDAVLSHVTVGSTVAVFDDAAANPGGPACIYHQNQDRRKPHAASKQQLRHTFQAVRQI